MGIIRSAITLAAAGIAANMVLKARRDGRLGRVEASPGLPSLPRSAPTDALVETGRAATTSLPGTVPGR